MPFIIGAILLIGALLGGNAILHSQPPVPTPTPIVYPTVIPTDTPIPAPVVDNAIDCIGPDGKHLRVTQQECDKFNQAWGKGDNYYAPPQNTQQNYQYVPQYVPGYTYQNVQITPYQITPPPSTNTYVAPVYTTPDPTIHNQCIQQCKGMLNVPPGTTLTSADYQSELQCEGNCP